ncbi:hypothetical protein ACIRPT_07510 [Streptomyces sp. NPDC101227]|uniref:hypothetical protein n=1 Tax=Streptomyces sp. NPDC101227 TaxID=3366136 RepID=UPI0038286EDC
MHAAELATRVMRVLTGDTPVPAEQASAVRELVWGRLGRTTLGASALARLHERPGEGSAGIVGSVLADEVRADPDFADQLLAVLPPLPAPPAHTAPHRKAAAVPPPPLVPPRMRATAPAPVAPDPAEMRKVLLLGLPQALLTYVVISLTVRWDGAGPALQVVLLLASAGLAAYGVWRGIRLFQRHKNSPLLCAGPVVLNALVLIRLVLWLVGA